MTSNLEKILFANVGVDTFGPVTAGASPKELADSLGRAFEPEDGDAVVVVLDTSGNAFEIRSVEEAMNIPPEDIREIYRMPKTLWQESAPKLHAMGHHIFVAPQNLN